MSKDGDAAWVQRKMKVERGSEMASIHLKKIPEIKFTRSAHSLRGTPPSPRCRLSSWPQNKRK